MSECMIEMCCFTMASFTIHILCFAWLSTRSNTVMLIVLTANDYLYYLIVLYKRFK